jgi:hypothetical protein
MPELSDLWQYDIAAISLRKVLKHGTPTFEFQIRLVDYSEIFFPLVLVGMYENSKISSKICIYPRASRMAGCGMIAPLLLIDLEQKLEQVLRAVVPTLPLS